MTESSTLGAVVPSVKSEQLSSAGEPPPPPATVQIQLDAMAMAMAEEVVDKDMLCPICIQIIKDAFLTACGHSFCYMCIVTHLQNKSDCPCCSHYLTTSHIYPNFLLNKLLTKTTARQIAKTATPSEQLRQALQQTGM